VHAAAPGAGAYEPGAQATQASEAMVAPGLAEAVPAGQRLQKELEVAPTACE